MKVKTKEQVKSTYQRKEVVDNYISKRYNEAYSIFEHEKQVKILNMILKKYKCKEILEIACGVGRVTSMANAKKGVAIDSSKPMLEAAKKKVSSSGKKWIFRLGDVFKFKFKKKFDIIYTFRFIFHFKDKERKKIYRQVNRALKKNGLLVFEALNKKRVEGIRRFVGKNKYEIYDKLWTRKELVNELEKNNFKVLALYPVLSHFWVQAAISKICYMLGLNQPAKFIVSLLDKIKSKKPYEWIVVCQKK